MRATLTGGQRKACATADSRGTTPQGCAASAVVCSSLHTAGSPCAASCTADLAVPPRRQATLDSEEALHYPRGVHLPTTRRRRVLSLLALVLLEGCAADRLELHPMEHAAASPSGVWTPPSTDRRDSRAAIGAELAPGRHVPEDIATATEGLGLPQLLDIGLRNSPATRQTWAAARAAAAAAAQARAAYYPQIDLGAMASAAKGIADRGTQEFEETDVGPGATLTYLLLDRGLRAGGGIRLIEAAEAVSLRLGAVRQALDYELDRALRTQIAPELRQLDDVLRRSLDQLADWVQRGEGGADLQPLTIAGNALDRRLLALRAAQSTHAFPAAQSIVLLALIERCKEFSAAVRHVGSALVPSRRGP